MALSVAVSCPDASSGGRRSLTFSLDAEGSRPHRYMTFVTYVAEGELDPERMRAMLRALAAKMATGTSKLRRLLAMPVRNYFDQLHGAPRDIVVVVFGLAAGIVKERAPFVIADVVEAALSDDRMDQRYLAANLARRRISVVDLPVAALLEEEHAFLLEMAETHASLYRRACGSSSDDAIAVCDADFPRGGEDEVFGRPRRLEYCCDCGRGELYKYAMQKPSVERKVGLILGRWSLPSSTGGGLLKDAALEELLSWTDELVRLGWIPAVKNITHLVDLMEKVVLAASGSAPLDPRLRTHILSAVRRARLVGDERRACCGCCGVVVRRLARPSVGGDRVPVLCSFACWRDYQRQILCEGCGCVQPLARKLREELSLGSIMGLLAARGHRCGACGGSEMRPRDDSGSIDASQSLWWCALAA